MNKVVVTLTGPSCSGKTTIEAELARRGLHKTVSTTSRTPRAGEVDGDAYHFVTPEVFTSMIHKDELVEHVVFNGTFYGLSKAEFEQGFLEGKAVVAVVEPNGRDQIKKFCAENGWKHVPVFVDGNPDVMLRRLAGRTALDLQQANLSDMNEPLVPAEKIYATLEKRLNTMRTVEFAWMREARLRKFPYTAYIRVSNENNFSMIVRFLLALTAAVQEPGAMIDSTSPYGIGDMPHFEEWATSPALAAV
jgi:guanylate kinase